jgi:hypothetical protein
MKSFLTSEPTPKPAKHCQGRFTPKEHLPRTLPYGYRFNGSGEWVLDETASKAVRRIFDLSLQGVFEADIAAALKAEQTPTPLEHRRVRSGKGITPACAWRTKAVRDILRDIQYTGALVCGKFGVKADGSGHFRTHESDWIVLPGKIPAIISDAEFQTVKEFIASHGRKRGVPTHLLRGNILKCGCCGYALAYDKISDPVYRCYHTAADAGADCHKLKIRAAVIDEIVLAAIRRKAQIVLDCADLSKLRRKNTDEQKIAVCESAVQQNTEDRQTLYERFVLGEISREEYIRLKEESSSQLDRLTLQLAAMKSELDAWKISPSAVTAAKAAVGETSNARELVEALIESVEVYPDKRIEISWKVSDFGIMG